MRTRTITSSPGAAGTSPAPAEPGPLTRLGTIYRSSVGRKYAMALSGLAILGFVIAHLLGTLKIYLGPEETNAYGEALRDLGGALVPRTHLLWILRAGLVIAFGVHLHAAFTLDRRNRRASSSIQTRQDFLAAGYASRTMLWSGIIVGLFIIYHLADLTWGAVNPDHIVGDPYANQISSFKRPLNTLIYLMGTAALSLHLFHGLYSLFQSVGISHPWLTRRARRRTAIAISGAIGIGYASIPIAVIVGIVPTT